MPKAPKNSEAVDTIKHLRALGQSWTAIGSRLGIDRRTAKKWFEIGTGIKPNEETFLVNTASPFSFARFKPVVVTGDIIAAPDWHIPLHDPHMVNGLIRVAREHNIKKLVIYGDYFHMDTFSHFLPHQPEADLNIERNQGSDIMRKLLLTFDEIVLSWGNHEHRFAKLLDFKLSFADCMRFMFQELEPELLERITFSELDYVMYETDLRTVRLCHQTNFSKVPLTVPRQLAMKHNCSVFSGHSHHFALGVALDGKNLIGEGGGLFDKAKTEYIQKTTTHHEWAQGFYMFKEGVPTPFSPLLGNMEVNS